MTANRRPPGGGLVTSPQAEAAYEGARVLDAGGNAADAVVAAAFVQGVVDPHRSGVGGFGCATLCFRNAPPLAVDFHGRVGRLARADQWENLFESAAPDGFGYNLRGKVNDVGYQSIALPGMVAGVSAMHERFGRLPWRDLVERAVPYAEEGFVVTPELAEFWLRPGLHGRVSTRDRLASTEAGRRICFKGDGAPYGAGEVFRQPELANTYRRIAREGSESFYRGELARRIASDWQQHDCLVSREDLDEYTPETREPLRGRYRDFEVLTTPLPGGGVALLQALRLFEMRDATRHGPGSPRSTHEMARVLQAVWQDRLTHQGDPAFGGPEAEHFLTDEYLGHLLERSDQAPPEPVAAPADGTTQLTVIDGWGNVVSFAHSLGYNSGVFTPGLGFPYNNCMSGFDPRPGRSNSIASGKARSTAIAETVLLRDGEPRLALGSGGGARITAALAEVIVNVVDYGMSCAEAVVCPRFDAYGPGTLLLESRFPMPLVRDLERRGWNVVHSPRPFGVVGRVYAIEISPSGDVSPGVDPGAPGAAYRQLGGKEGTADRGTPSEEGASTPVPDGNAGRRERRPPARKERRDAK
ncbi:MAG: gamma-glutamyltransferase [Planctomycetota bacterium]|nr:gamma-glutamyltransferase [Planctomycetota bacterium]